MAEAPFDANATRKKRILRISGIFVGVMLFFTFFSNTINHFSLPRVSTEQPAGGALIKELEGSGPVQAKETAKVYATQGRLVNEVRVKPGDPVKKGQVIVVLDKEETERQLKEEMLRYDQMKLNLEKLADQEPVVEAAERNLEAAKETAEAKRSLYDSGAITKEELKQSENALHEAEKELDGAKRKQRDQERDIKIQQDTLQLEEMAIGKLEQELNEKSALVSPVDGIVGEVNVTQGSLVNAALPVFTVADTSKGFEVRITVDQEMAQYLAIGDEVGITIKSVGGDTIKGTISEVTDNVADRGEKKDLSVDIPADGILGGERCDIYISKKTKAYTALVPNTAVGTDPKGRFVWILKERKGSLGTEFYVQRAQVAVDDSDSSKTAVISGISSEDQIVVSFSRNLSDGGRVLPD